MSRENDSTFETVVVRHLDAAYNLARWLLGNDQDAEDVVQDSAIRALGSLKNLRGQDGKSWFLAIVRNGCFNRTRQRKSRANLELAMEDEAVTASVATPEEFAIKAWQAEVVHAAINELPIGFREVIVLRELEDMSYKEIAKITDLPMGTVMSRLARGRERLQANLMASEAQ